MTRLMYALMAGVVLTRLGVLGYSAVSLDHDLNRQAAIELRSSADVLAEHSLRVLHDAEVLMDYAERASEALTDSQIRADQPGMHALLGSIAHKMSEVKSVWVIAADGQPLAASERRVTPDASRSDRDYFRAFLGGDSQVFVGQVLLPRAAPGPAFFSVSRAVAAPDGGHRLVEVSVLPTSLTSFFSHLQPEDGLQYSLLRADGVVLARYPAPASPILRLDPGSALLRQIIAHPEGGVHRLPDATDRFERFVDYRKLDGFPVFVVASIDPGAIRDSWVGMLKSYVVFGFPATFAILLLLFIAFQRTLRLYRESDARKVAEAALARVQRLDALGQLTGGVAHDFNNLLTVVVGGVELLRDRTMQPADARALDMIETAARRGEALTRQLLTFSRRQALDEELFEVAGQVRRFENVLGRSLRGDIAVTLDLPEQPCMVKVDAGEFELALLNLAVNARDAMPQGGRLTIKVRATRLDGDAETDRLRGAFIAVTVTDSGTGIQPDVLARVFDPFFTTKDVGKGTGLGLSQVYGFARQSGGATTLASTPGRGTAVTLLLPVSTDAATAAAAVAVPAVAPPSPARVTGEGRRVLLVEDNGDVALVCRRFLEGFGYEVAAVPDAAAALRRLREDAWFDLVLSDVVMPGGMNGIELARELRRLRPDLPVLLATGYSASADQAIRDGFVILRKPFDMKRLRTAVEQALRLPDANGRPLAAGH